MSNFVYSKPVRIRGCIEKFKHFDPKVSILLPKPLHEYEIQIDDYSQLVRLEETLDDVQEEYEKDRYLVEAEEESKLMGYVYQSSIIDGTSVSMCTFHTPTLSGTLSKISDDSEFLGLSAQFLCHIHRQPNGNTYLMPYLIEPCKSAGQLYREEQEDLEEDMDMPWCPAMDF